MSDKNLNVIPIGGLANRMRAIASAVSLSNQVNRKLKVIWHKDKGLFIDFNSLFDTSGITYFEIENIGDLYFNTILEVPRKRNLYLTNLTNLLSATRRIFHCDNNPTDWLLDKNLETFCKESSKPISVMSGSSFYPFQSSLIRDIFKPSPQVLKRKTEILKDNHPDIGLHIRRTDNKASIQNSPVSLFIEKIEKELSKNPSSLIYLASDNQDVKNEIKNLFPDNIFFNEENARRDTKEGMLDAFSEMLILSDCKKIYGSFWSSFSEIASMYGDSEIEILTKNL